MTIEVMLDSEVTDAERAAIAEVFKSVGIKVDIQAAYIRRGWPFPLDNRNHCGRGRREVHVGRAGRGWR